MICKIDSTFTKGEYLSILDMVEDSGIDVVFETRLRSKKMLLAIISFYKGKYLLKTELYERGNNRHILSSSKEEEIDGNLKNISLSLQDKDSEYIYSLLIK